MTTTKTTTTSRRVKTISFQPPRQATAEGPIKPTPKGSTKTTARTTSGWHREQPFRREPVAENCHLTHPASPGNLLSSSSGARVLGRAGARRGQPTRVCWSQFRFKHSERIIGKSGAASRSVSPAPANFGLPQVAAFNQIRARRRPSESTSTVYTAADCCCLSRASCSSQPAGRWSAWPAVSSTSVQLAC